MLCLVSYCWHWPFSPQPLHPQNLSYLTKTTLCPDRKCFIRKKIPFVSPSVCMSCVCHAQTTTLPPEVV